MPSDKEPARGLNGGSFTSLLARLGPDADRAGTAYEDLRRTLVSFFRWRGASTPEECADETLDRLAAKIHDGVSVEDVPRFARGIARLVLLEHWRSPHAQEALAEDHEPPAPTIPLDEDEEVLHQCLDRCLGELDAEGRPPGPQGPQGVQGPEGPQGVPGPGDLMAMKAALLQWYRKGFAVGSNPYGVATDGANVWVANGTANSVTKLRVADGANVGTFPVGSLPRRVAFDGVHIWVTNSGSNNVTKLRASDGVNLGTFPVGSQPFGIAFDGANIWVANFGNSVTKLRASDGATLGTFPVTGNAYGVAFDGANVWMVGGTLTKLRASDGANLGTFPVGGPYGVAFDGANIWVTNATLNSVTRY